MNSNLKRNIFSVILGAALGAAICLQAFLPAEGDVNYPRGIIGVEQVKNDVRVTGTVSNPQVLMATDPIEFDGGPVVVELSVEYLNHLPAAGTQLNGIGFDLTVDGVRVERLTLAGTHSVNNDFWPINIRDLLINERAIPSGSHTIGINVWRWNSTQDGYLKYSTGYIPNYGMPITLTVWDV